jgi:hypothetical protein
MTGRCRLLIGNTTAQCQPACQIVFAEGILVREPAALCPAVEGLEGGKVVLQDGWFRPTGAPMKEVGAYVYIVISTGDEIRGALLQLPAEVVTNSRCHVLGSWQRREKGLQKTQFTNPCRFSRKCKSRTPTHLSCCAGGVNIQPGCTVEAPADQGEVLIATRPRVAQPRNGPLCPNPKP